MIVNPYDPRSGNQQIKLMRFHQSPQWGYYAEPPEMGYYAEPPGYAYYAEPPEYGYYAEPSEYGYYAAPAGIRLLRSSRNTATTASRRKWLTTASRRSSPNTAMDMVITRNRRTTDTTENSRRSAEYEPPVGYYAEEQPIGRIRAGAGNGGLPRIRAALRKSGEHRLLCRTRSVGLRPGNGRAAVQSWLPDAD